MKDVVSQGQLFGLATVAGVKKAENVQDREDEWDDGQLDPDDPVPAWASSPVRSNAHRQYEATVTVAEIVRVDLRKDSVY